MAAQIIGIRDLLTGDPGEETVEAVFIEFTVDSEAYGVRVPGESKASLEAMGKPAAIAIIKPLAVAVVQDVAAARHPLVGSDPTA